MNYRVAIILAVLALAGCNNTLDMGTRVTDQGNGHYRITTSQADDVAKANAAAARETCPGGYTLVSKGVSAESLYGSMIKGADLASYWDIKCVQPKKVTAFVALLRAVNVGGTGKMPMSDLKTLCEAAGFAKVKTYIASGNVVFEAAMTEAEAAAALDSKLIAYAGKPVGVLVRTAAEMAAVLDANPFPDAAPNLTVAIFLDNAPGKQALDDVVAPDGEEVRLGKREIYVHYPKGQGRSKLKLPAAKAGTARNINTVGTLARMAGAL